MRRYRQMRGARRRALGRAGGSRAVLNGRALLVAVCVLAAAVALLCGCGGNAGPRVLFIGNSFTSYNSGLDVELHDLDPGCTTSSVAIGGATLQRHWDLKLALNAIRSGHWDYVVLQEQSQTPVIDRPLFARYAARFNAAIEESGAHTVLLMTWQRPDSLTAGVTTANLSAAYRGVGATLGARVAPAGEAFAAALAARPDIMLNQIDGHPTPAGTYLAACVVYRTIVGRSPVGLGYADPAVPADVRAFLQEIAGQSTSGS